MGKNGRVPEIRFPGFTDDWEQRKLSEKIAGFFRDLITLHQRKLDNMKDYKKGLLQKMFV